MNLRTRIMIIGGVLGGLLGAGAAYLYLQSTPVEMDEEGKEQLPTVQPSSAITASLGILAAIKQVVGLGQS